MSKHEAARQLARAAIHEAGHAVTMLAVGIPVVEVRAGVERPIFSAPRATGVTSGAGSGRVRVDNLSRPQIVQLAATWLAGVEAEARYARLVHGVDLVRARKQAIRAYGRGGDMESVRMLCGELGWFSRGEVERATESLVRAHWDAIQRVAAELEKRGKLTGAQLSWLV